MTLFRLPTDLVVVILEQWLSYDPIDLIYLEKACKNSPYTLILLKLWKMVKFRQFYDDYGADALLIDVSFRRNTLKWISRRGIHVESAVVLISTFEEMLSGWGDPLSSVTTLRLVSDELGTVSSQRDLIALFDQLPNLTALDLSQWTDVYDYTFTLLFSSLHRQACIRHLDVSCCTTLDMHSVSIFTSLHRDSLQSLHMDGVSFDHETLLDVLRICKRITTLSINAITLLPHQLREIAQENPRIEHLRLYFGDAADGEDADAENDGDLDYLDDELVDLGTSRGQKYNQRSLMRIVSANYHHLVSLDVGTICDFSLDSLREIIVANKDHMKKIAALYFLFDGDATSVFSYCADSLSQPAHLSRYYAPNDQNTETTYNCLYVTDIGLSEHNYCGFINTVLSSAVECTRIHVLDLALGLAMDLHSFSALASCLRTQSKANCLYSLSLQFAGINDVADGDDKIRDVHGNNHADILTSLLSLLHNLSSLNLHNAFFASDTHIDYINRHFAYLEEFSITQATQVTDAAMVVFLRDHRALLPKLGNDHWVQKRLQALNISGCSQLTELTLYAIIPHNATLTNIPMSKSTIREYRKYVMKYLDMSDIDVSRDVYETFRVIYADSYVENIHSDYYESEVDSEQAVTFYAMSPAPAGEPTEESAEESEES